MGEDPLRRLDDPQYPSLTMSQAAELLSVQPAFLRSLDSSGVLHPQRSPGGHRRYSREQLTLAARIRELIDDGHPVASAGAIVQLQDQLADAQADLADARADGDRLRASLNRPRSELSPRSRGTVGSPAGLLPSAGGLV
ncbi:MerR family transcriptional regulator [Blastococcus sp. MG754426]|uniref:helix-turn-helix domain-containing protein n=1 Tax=unclassified Blastococcus TaxID=2619396 RepID=UPI001EF0E388|nr:MULTISPECIES: helix-turn-helix domain-containing protein [unclassified Blastococcus]MCF6507466.1 MerR family transcriptional regulator [Blastococcus sp. MG754426]MCF6512583.1 MerR family transcriptional regulator [Blastococcus sp. MG754427]